MLDHYQGKSHIFKMRRCAAEVKNFLVKLDSTKNDSSVCRCSETVNSTCTYYSPDVVISTVMFSLISTGDSTTVRAATVVLVVKKVPELIIAVSCLN